MTPGQCVECDEPGLLDEAGLCELCVESAENDAAMRAYELDCELADSEEWDVENNGGMP